MHRRAEELGVRVARSCRPDTVGAVAEFADQVGYPVVVKPYAGWACGSTYRVDDREELDRVWAEMGDDRHEYRVEEFIRGTGVPQRAGRHHLPQIRPDPRRTAHPGAERAGPARLRTEHRRGARRVLPARRR
ncbi:hypothetical protein ACFW7J_06180 [Streptomyces sp. NPDC059525]|uniref:ATP-binding protein n=1 Tax=Streptomyces sp. NPDC059525 TaxID=3346857 RepID=UPI0036C76A7D